MFEPLTLSIAELADRWNRTPSQILDYALSLGVPLYFMFDGMAFDVSDEWHRHGGDWQQSRELETLSESILGRKAWIKRSASGENGEYEQRLTSEDAKALRAKIEADKRKQTALTELLEQRSIERYRCEYRGYLRAAPSTLWDIATTGAAQFPHKAFHPHSPIHIATLPDRSAQVWDGRMVALEPVPGSERYKKDTLTTDDLCAFMVEVKAIEAHQAAKHQTAPAPSRDMHSLLNELHAPGMTTAQPAAIDPEFISLRELLSRIQKAHTVPLTLTQAAHILLSWGLRTNGAPALKCNGKRGIVLADAMQTKCATDRLEYVYHRGQFESDAATGASTDYELFGFDRSEFSEFVTQHAGESLDLLTPLTDTAPASEPAPAPTATPGDAIEALTAPMLKQAAQEKRILELIENTGFDALKLPRSEPGKKGIKSEIKTLALKQPKIFTANSFDKAWQRLRDDGKVTEE